MGSVIVFYSDPVRAYALKLKQLEKLNPDVRMLAVHVNAEIMLCSAGTGVHRPVYTLCTGNSRHSHSQGDSLEVAL